MVKLIETKFSSLKTEMESALGGFSVAESIERVAKRGEWRRAEQPNNGEIFSTFGEGTDEPLCVAAILPGPLPRVALVAIWSKEKGVVEIIGAAREPDIRLKIFKLAEIWRECSGIPSKQKSRKRWSGLENPD